MSGRIPDLELSAFLLIVRELRARGRSWRECGEILGMNMWTVRTRYRYNTDPEWRLQYKERQRTRLRSPYHPAYQKWSRLRHEARAQAKLERRPNSALYAEYGVRSFDEWYSNLKRERNVD